jgi:hypothetical protein
MHLLRQMNPALTRLVMPHLTTSELETFGLQVVDAEAQELPSGRADPDPRARSPVSSQTNPNMPPAARIASITPAIA